MSNKTLKPMNCKLVSKDELLINETIKIVNIIFTLSMQEIEFKAGSHPIFFQTHFYFDTETNNIFDVAAITEQSGEWELEVYILSADEQARIDKLIIKVCTELDKETLVHSLIESDIYKNFNNN